MEIKSKFRELRFSIVIWFIDKFNVYEIEIHVALDSSDVFRYEFLQVKLNTYCYNFYIYNYNFYITLTKVQEINEKLPTYGLSYVIILLIFVKYEFYKFNRNVWLCSYCPPI